MPGKKLSPQDLEHFRAQLKKMLGVLSGDIQNLAADAQVGKSGTEHQGDDGDGYNADFSLDLMERDEKTAERVHAALERIAAGKFGICQDCEQRLLKERLRAMPHASRCIACQRASESQES